jgi:crotonobetainyl-CoA:carnitine CoA-transferase CaiB-like acyl-CoA transferase
MAGALQGIRVLDCTQIIAGPLSASLLAEMGADVVKVEPLEGEPWRLQAEIIPKESRGFLSQNRGKRGISIDLKQPAAGAVRERLIAWADVLITNYRPGVPEQLGIDYESARTIRPDIIYCESTAFGKVGPDSSRRGYDIVAQAMSGLATSNPNVSNGFPMWIAFAPADVVTGIAMAWAVTAALFHRERTGEGQAIDASLLLSAVSLQAGFKEISAFDLEPRQKRLAALNAARERGASIEEIFAERRAAQPELAGNIYYRGYRTSDGYMVVGCLGPEPRARFRKAVAIHDPRYEDEFESTPENLRAVGEQLTQECEQKFRLRTTDEWVQELSAQDIACGPVRFIDELWQDPQIVENEYIATYEHSLLGTIRANAPIVRMSATPTSVPRASPVLGEHTDEVLAELGFDREFIEGLHTAGVIG